jgi:hypothetical protein
MKISGWLVGTFWLLKGPLPPLIDTLQPLSFSASNIKLLNGININGSGQLSGIIKFGPGGGPALRTHTLAGCKELFC